MIRGLSLCEAFSLPPRAIIETEANRHSADADAVFCTAPSRLKASFRRSGTAQKKRMTSSYALLQFRDSVGIRTQDPQLRRLLLYPTELPNRSLLLPAGGLKTAFSSKVAAKICYFFEMCNL